MGGISSRQKKQTVVERYHPSRQHQRVNFEIKVNNRSTELPFPNLPKDLNHYIFQNVKPVVVLTNIQQFFDIPTLLSLRALAFRWRAYIDNASVIWRSLYYANFTEQVEENETTNWFSTFATTWREVKHASEWDTSFTRASCTFSDSNRTITHGPGICYIPIRTKLGKYRHRFI